MCGIAGFIDFTKKSTLGDLQKMTDTLVHRGPDGGGYEVIDFDHATIGLGHRRLSIIDLTDTGSQPMSDERYKIIFNGEIYNYKEIKDELVSQGFTFQSASDTEVILKSFVCWGKDAVHRFNGMFVFVIVDTLTEGVFIFRDRAGVKPLYVYQKDGLILFASELKAFHKHSSFYKEIDTSALALYLRHGYIPVPHCIFKHVKKLRSGHILEIDSKKQLIEEKKYWDVFDLYNRKKLDLSIDEAIDHTHKLLKSSFQYRLVSDVPVGVFLSGGYDSSAVAAILQNHSDTKIKTFTIGFNEAKYNEAPYAKDVARHLGTDHREYYCSTKEAQEIIPDLPYYFDEPFGDSSAIPTTLVSKLAKEDVTVALSADGGDEIFAGYGKYPALLSKKTSMDGIPNFVKIMIGNIRTTASSLNYYPSLRRKRRSKLVKDRLWAFKEMECRNDLDISTYLKHNSYRCSDALLARLLKSDFVDLNTNFDTVELLNDGNDDLHKLMAIDYKTYMLDDILTKVDRATMSVSLEGREPFLDYRIIDFVSQLPSDYKMRNGNKKYILKQIVHEYLPKELMDRPKMGFGVPVVSWFRDSLKFYFDKYLGESYLTKQDIFHPQIILEAKQDYYNGKVDCFEFLWFVLMFQLWYEKWMD